MFNSLEVLAAHVPWLVSETDANVRDYFPTSNKQGWKEELWKLTGGRPSTCPLTHVLQPQQHPIQVHSHENNDRKTASP